MEERTLPSTSSARAENQRRTRSFLEWAGILTLVVMILSCVGSIPWTMGRAIDPFDPEGNGRLRFDMQSLDAHLLPPSWAPYSKEEKVQLADYVEELKEQRETLSQSSPDLAKAIDTTPYFALGSDELGRDFLTRCLAGGGISLGIGIAAALISVLIGTTYGMIAGYLGGRVDAVMMRFVDILYGLPYILLVVLLAVGMNGIISRFSVMAETARKTALEAGNKYEAPFWLEFIEGHAGLLNVLTLLVAIGGVSWLTMARVIRGQVLSLKRQPFIEATRAIGVPIRQQFVRHLLPNLMGPIIVYATLTVPQAILQESFLSFLGIGIEPPLPSWGNLAAAGLSQLNPVESRWWLLLWPCLLLGLTLLALNFVGEGLREAFDPRRRTTASSDA